MPVTDIKELGNVVRDVAGGVASDKDTGLVLKTLKMSMTLKLANGLSDMLYKLGNQSAMVDRCMDEYTRMMRDKMDSGTATSDELIDFVNSSQQKMISILEIYRRCLQNGNLFDSDSLSSEERLILSMVRQLDSVEKKTRFFQLCKDSGLFT